MSQRQISIIGCPMDLGAGRRGVDMGPSSLRKAGILQRLAGLGHSVHDLGNVPVGHSTGSPGPDERLRYLKEIAEATANLADTVLASLAEGRLPVILGGDHSMSIGSLAGAGRHSAPTGQTLGVLWVDAHADINTPQTSQSGNIHGMPLAVALGHGADDLTSIGGPQARLQPGNLVYIGLRSVDPGEKEMIHRLGIRAYTMREIDESGIAGVTAKALDYLLARCGHLHVSFDLDVLDPSVAPGVGTPVPGGLSYREGHYLMETIAETGRLASLDIAEVNPILDVRNTSSEVATELAASVLGLRVL